MRLPQSFHRLGVKFDAARMREEMARIPESAWAMHPNGIPGNSSIRLISVNGEENDDVNGFEVKGISTSMISPTVTADAFETVVFCFLATRSSSSSSIISSTTTGDNLVPTPLMRFMEGRSEDLIWGLH